MIIFLYNQLLVKRWQGKPWAQVSKIQDFQSALFQTKFQGKVIYD